MKRITRWSPDTCGCVLEYEWDDALPNDQEPVLRKVVKRCSEHTEDGEALYNRVLQENRLKNQSIGELMRANPEIEHREYTWWFDTGRNLKINLPEKLSGKKNVLKGLLNSKFGAGKVELL